MRAATIPELRARIARKRRARQSTARDEVALQDAIHDELRAGIEAEAHARGRDRREPGSFQRELVLDE